MFYRLVSWFEHRYNPVGLATNRQPPMGLWKFILYFVRQFRTAFLIRLVFVAIGAVADAMMPIFVGLVVGFLATTARGEMFTAHGQALLWMIVVIAVVRPL